MNNYTLCDSNERLLLNLPLGFVGNVFFVDHSFQSMEDIIRSMLTRVRHVMCGLKYTHGQTR